MNTNRHVWTVLASLPWLAGCSTVIERDPGADGSGGGPGNGGTTSSSGGTAPLSSRKIDLVFAVDNSSDAGETKAFAIDAAAVLLERLTNPDCVDAQGRTSRVASAALECPAGSRRAFTPATDMHVGVVTSSLGGLGSSACQPEGATLAANPTKDDRGHLVWRTDPDPANSVNPSGTTYEDRGFFWWDPQATQSPPGLSDLAVLKDRVGDVIRGAGDAGCGFEMPLESTYRFLVDPAPYNALVEEDDPVASIPARVPSGVDQAVLDQRRAFLRDDSILIVVMLGTENDCSVLADGQAWATLRPGEGWYRGTSVCESDPADSCCSSCGLLPPDGCSSDARCASQPQYAPAEDPLSLRCSMQQRRYGISLLYPIERYVNAFSSPTLTTDVVELAGGLQTVPNPLFAGRSAHDVFFVSVAGIPWQATVDDPGSLSPRILDAPGRDAASFAERYVGQTDAGIDPSEPIMRESIDPRPGVAPQNPYNGGDYAVPNRDALQLACTFPLATPNPNDDECALHPERPTCAGTTQTHGAAYPTTRQLRLANELGSQGIVASACPPEAIDAASPTYGYRLAIDALARSLSER